MLTTPPLGADVPANSPLPQVNADGFLQELIILVRNLERKGATVAIPLTLHASGMLVSGTLITYATYFEKFASDFSKPIADPDVSAAMAKYVRGFGAPADPKEEDQDDATPPRFIHLRDARFFGPGSSSAIPSNHGALVRMRLSEVAGYFLGAIAAEAG